MQNEGEEGDVFRGNAIDGRDTPCASGQLLVGYTWKARFLRTLRSHFENECGMVWLESTEQESSRGGEERRV